MVSFEQLAGILARLDRAEGATQEGPHAAVAAIVREGAAKGSIDMFFIRRADQPGDPWSGHIAFPGGRRDPEDTSLLATAIRETREEVGIDLTEAELLGRLPDLPAFTKRAGKSFVVATFIFAVRGDVAITTNHEVAETFWLPLGDLATGAGKGTFAFDYEGRKYEVPCFRFGAVEPQHVLWGLTHRMVESMLEELSRDSVL